MMISRITLKRSNPYFILQATECMVIVKTILCHCHFQDKEINQIRSLEDNSLQNPLTLFWRIFRERKRLADYCLGDCADEFFLVTGGSKVPPICGLNTG
jgi:hypothetical protein